MVAGARVALPSPPGAVDPVSAERVALEPGEQVVEDLLADPPAAARCQIHPLAVARQVASLLEPAGEVVERLELAQLSPTSRGPSWSMAPDRRATHVGSAFPDDPRLQPAIWARLLGTSGSSPPNGPIAEPGQQVEFDASWAVDEQPVCRSASSSTGALRAGRTHRSHEPHRGHPISELIDDVVESRAPERTGVQRGTQASGRRLRSAPG
jgi:hypothetical protein